MGRATVIEGRFPNTLFLCLLLTLVRNTITNTIPHQAIVVGLNWLTPGDSVVGLEIHRHSALLPSSYCSHLPPGAMGHLLTRRVRSKSTPGAQVQELRAAASLIRLGNGRIVPCAVLGR